MLAGHGRAHQQPFANLKVAFSTAPTLAFFDYSRKTILETDASDWASGGVLSQIDDEGYLRPVAYFSSKHSASECNYEIYDKELLAIIKSLEEWRPELQGIQEPFEIITDHKNLQYFMTTKALNQRQVRWSEFLSGFNFRIVYRPGNKAVRPDALSRKREDRPSKTNASDERLKNRERVLLPADRFESAALEDLLAEANSDPDIDMTAAPIDMVIPATEKPIDDLIAAAYASSNMAKTMLSSLRDPECRKWPKLLRKQLRIAMTDCKIVENKIYYRDKLFLPPDDELRTQVIYRTHSTGPAGHPGRTKTLDLLSRTY
jgi:RNase H-like domain found in reverse transcriptase/Integrase zinc binding domain